MKLIKTRYSYWSCTKFANKLRKLGGLNSKPRSATMEQWDEWNIKQSQSNKLVYWITEEGLNKLQDIVMWPSDVINTIMIYYRNRFVDKTHLVTTSLKKGEWHEYDTILMHAMFQVLVDFVEQDCAILMDRNRTKLDKWKARLFGYRNKQKGIEYLKLEMSLTDEPYQSSKAKEIFDLYMWWTVERPNRKSGWEVTGLQEVYREMEMVPYKRGTFGESMKQYEKYRHLHEQSDQIEKQYDLQDTEMMHRLIEVRKHLWS